MKTSPRQLLLLAALTTLALAACGGSPATAGPGSSTGSGAGQTTPAGSTGTGGGTATQPPGGGATVDPCALLTAADIEAVTGNTVASTVAGPQAGIFPTGCLWELIDADAIVPPTIALGIMSTGGRAYYDRYFAPFNAAAGYKPIEGLGDEAVDADAGVVMVVVGDAFLQVQWIGGTLGDDGDLEVDIARRVVANLGP